MKNAFASSLGYRLKTLRRQQQRTLREIADVCHFTISLLSKIESGLVNPPVATLARIAGALGVAVGDLLAESADTATVMIPGADVVSQSLTRADKGYAFHVLAAARANKLMQPFLFIVERGKIKSGSLSHEGEEFVYVLEGQIRYSVGETSWTLKAGDSLYFSSIEEHDVQSISKRAVYLAVFATASIDSPKSSLKLSRKKSKGRKAINV